MFFAVNRTVTRFLEFIKEGGGGCKTTSPSLYNKSVKFILEEVHETHCIKIPLYNYFRDLDDYNSLCK